MSSVSDYLFSCFLCDPHYLTNEQKSFIVEQYRTVGKQAIYDFADKKKVIPFVAHCLMSVNCDYEFWKEKHDVFTERNNRVIELLCDLFSKLDRAGCNRVCVTENFAAVLASNACVGCFASGDVDLFVDKIDLPKVDKVVKAMGFVLGDRHKRKKSFANEYYNEDLIGSKFWLNFQWAPLTRRKTHLYDQHEITRRLYGEFDNLCNYKNTPIRILSPEAMLYFNLHHIASGHYYVLTPQFRLYADIDRPLRNMVIDLGKVINWSEKDNAGFRTMLPIYISNRFLNTPIDENIFVDLLKNPRFIRLKKFLIDEKEMTISRAPSGVIGYLRFLTKVELYSDDSNMNKALLKRVKALFRKEL